tara:strand:- start:798 stop:2693 length:1896 start_codon:yes stop_codon:yes gene_type:complete
MSVNYPAVSANDIMLMIVVTATTTNLTSSPPTGWTKVLEIDSYATIGIYWYLATSSASASTGNTWSDVFSSNEDYYVWVGAYSGCDTTTPVDASNSQAHTGYNTAWSISITTQTNNAMIVTAFGRNKDDKTATFSDGTQIVSTYFQNEGYININEKIEATAGSHTRSATFSGNGRGAKAAIALKPSGATSYRATVLADNPLFYYRLGEASGTTAYDEVATSSNGTYYNTPDLGQTGAISGDSNTAVKFKEASSEYAETVTLSSETSLLPCTIECFIKTDGASDSNAGIVFYRETNAQASGLNILGSTLGKLGYTWNDASNTYTWSSGPTLSDDTWYYVALVVESTKATIYVIDESGTLTTPAVNSVSHSALNCSGDGWNIARDTASLRYFQGTLDEVALYDQALSQSTVVAHAAAAGFTAPTAITLETSATTTGINYSGATTINVNIPAVSANDILILYCATYDAADATSSPPSGWTKIREQDCSSVYGSTVAVYWKRASGSATATTETWTSFYSANEAYYVWVGAYSGCATSTSPIDVDAGGTASYASSVATSFTTTVDNAMVVSMIGVYNSATTWSPDGEIVDVEFNSGLDAHASISESIESSAGSKTVTGTFGGAGRSSIVSVALKPA